MSGTTMARRFDIGAANQPIVQFMAATTPFFLLLLWFVQQAAVRGNKACYSENPNNMNDDAAIEAMSEECAKLVPLKQFVYIFLGTGFLWMLLAVYLTFYVPRRHKLVDEYLTQGLTVIGDVYYKRKRGVGTLTSYGHVVYPHPNDCTLIRRKCQVFERYTRERAAILYLPGQPFSGQPKVDLEIDHQVCEVNKRRMEILYYFSWAWTAFCLIVPIYIVKVMERLDETYGDAEETVWHPDTDLGNFSMWFYLSAFCIIPAAALLWNVVAWYYYKWWATSQSKELEDDEPEDPSYERNGCCFDDDDCESIEQTEYVPPQQSRAVHGTTRLS